MKTTKPSPDRVTSSLEEQKLMRMQFLAVGIRLRKTRKGWTLNHVSYPADFGWPWSWEALVEFQRQGREEGWWWGEPKPP
jgi:hypothetical protein